jgi:hypothetical protein
MRLWVTSMTRRRSKLSATTPLTIENAMMGRMRTAPVMPNASPRASGGTRIGHVPENGRVLHHAAGHRHELAQPQEPEVAMAERGDVVGERHPGYRARAGLSPSVVLSQRTSGSITS